MSAANCVERQVLLRDITPGATFFDGKTECRMIGPHGANMAYEYKNSFGWQTAFMPWFHEVTKQENGPAQPRSP